MANENPSWPDMLAALNQQRDDIVEEFKDLKANIRSLELEVKQSLSSLRHDFDEDKKDLREQLNDTVKKEVERLDNRINALTGVGITLLVLSISALVGIVIDVLKLRIFP